MAVSRAQRSDIGGPCCARLDKARPAPRESAPSKADSQNVRGEAGVAAVSVGKGVDKDQPVMKPDGCLIGRIGSVLDPKSRIIEEAANIGGYIVSLDADIPRGHAIFSGPAPNFAEHAFVQPAQKRLVEGIPTPRKSPLIRCGDIRLFRLVKLSPGGDIGGDKRRLFLRRQRS